MVKQKKPFKPKNITMPSGKLKYMKYKKPRGVSEKYKEK